MEDLSSKCLNLGRQPGRFPSNDAAGKMSDVSISRILRGDRSGYGAPSGTAGEYNLLPLGIRNRARVEARQWHDHRIGIGLDRSLIRFPYINQQHAFLTQAGGDFFRR